MSDYNDSLVQAFGTSSSSFHRALVDSRFVPKPGPQFDADQKQVALQLLRGQIAAVDLATVSSLDRVQRRATRATASDVAQLERLERDLNAMIVDTGDAKFTASDAVNQFVESYDHLIEGAIAQNRTNLKGLRSALRSNRTTERFLGDLARFKRTGQLGSLPKSLHKARRAVLVTLRLGAAFDAGHLKARLDKLVTPLVQQANNHHHPEVSKFVDAVKSRYPRSLLNDVLVRPGS